MIDGIGTDDRGSASRSEGGGETLPDPGASRKTADESLRLFGGLFAHSPAAIAAHQIVTDEVGRPVDYVYLAANPAFEKLTGLGNVVGRRVTEVLPGVEAHYVERFGRVALTGEPDEWEDYVEALDRWYDIVAFSPTPGEFVAVFNETTQRRRSEHVLQALARATATSGAAFFPELVRELVASLRVRFAMVSEIVLGGERADTLAVCRDGEIVARFSYALAGSPCEVAIAESTCLVASRAREQFPDDDLLARMDIESYHGTLVRDPAGRPLGVLAVMDDRPMPDDDGRPVGDLLRLCAARVGAELERMRADSQMHHLLLHDPSTGLPNRTLLEDRLKQAVAHAARNRGEFALAVVGLERLAKVTESLGHSVAEKLVLASAARLTATLREVDTLARTDSHEFMVLLPESGGSLESGVVVERMLGAFAEHFPVDGHDVFLRPSIGVAVFPHDGSERGELIRSAETAKHQVESDGGNGWRFFHESMNEETGNRIDFERNLHRALEQGRFVLQFQPQVDAGSGMVVGVEALVRREDARHGLVLPREFLGLAEETGLIIPIGAWVLNEACRQARRWSAGGHRSLRIAVNLSSRQFEDRDLVGTVRRALETNDLRGNRLELEITETAALHDPERTGATLGELKEMGVRIALDDFGTGFSSLSHLVRLPIDTVKIDGSFIAGFDREADNVIIASAVIALGHRLGLTVVAEGVETPEQAAFLHKERCDVLQGFLFSRPLGAPECEVLLGNDGLCDVYASVAAIDLGEQSHFRPPPVL